MRRSIPIDAHHHQITHTVRKFKNKRATAHGFHTPYGVVFTCTTAPHTTPNHRQRNTRARPKYDTRTDTRLTTNDQRHLGPHRAPSPAGPSSSLSSPVSHRRRAAHHQSINPPLLTHLLHALTAHCPHHLRYMSIYSSARELS